MSIFGERRVELVKDPIKPWGKKERFWILFVLAASVLLPLWLAFGAYGGLKIPKLNLNLNFGNFFKGETIVVGNKLQTKLEKQRQKAQKTIGQFKQQTGNLVGTYAFYMVDIETGYAFGVNKGKVMQAASLIKLPLMLYAQEKVDGDKIEALGKTSDNNVFRELVAKFGQKAIQDYIDGLAMDNTSLAKNETTPEEIGELLLKIYQDKNEEILNYLTDTIFEDWIKKGAPEGIRVAHKYGREVGVVNDAGVIYSPKPFILVIMTQGVSETEADKNISELAKMIYSIHEEGENIF